MAEKDFSEVTRAVMTDMNYQTLMAKTQDIWLLMSACQCMQVQSGLHGELKRMYRDLGGRLQAVIAHIHPEAKELAARGWDTYVPIDLELPDSTLKWPFYWLSPDDDDYPDDEMDIPL